MTRRSCLPAAVGAAGLVLAAIFCSAQLQPRPDTAAKAELLPMATVAQTAATSFAALRQDNQESAADSALALAVLPPPNLVPAQVPAQPADGILDANPADDPAAIALAGWNIGLDDASAQVIARQMAAYQDVDLWGIAEVNTASAVPVLEMAAADGEGARYASVLGESGGGMRLLALFDTGRFDLINDWEVDHINTTGNARAPLVLHLRERTTGAEFLFMVNHLYRSRDEERHRQAQLLAQWAAEQTLPVVAVGDYNFDWDVADGAANHDAGYDLMTAGGVWDWVEPPTLTTTQCSGWPCQYDSVLDFVFLAGPAQGWRAESQIVVRAGDFPDDDTTSDHRPVLARVWPGAGAQPAPPTPAPAIPVVTGPAELRAGPGAEHLVVGGAVPGQVVSVAGRDASGTWLQVAEGGWIAAHLVSGAPADLPMTALPTPLPPRPTATPFVPAVPVVNGPAATYAGPSTGYAVVGGAVQGQVASVVGRDTSGAWLQLVDGTWIAAYLVDGVPAYLPVAAYGGMAAPAMPVQVVVPEPPVPAPLGSSQIVIQFINYDGSVYRVESDEYAVIANNGSEPVNLGGWRLYADDPGQDFIFPGIELAPGASCRVYTNEYYPDTCGLSFGRGQAIWNNEGDCGYLYDAGGNLVNSYCYGVS